MGINYQNNGVKRMDKIPLGKQVRYKKQDYAIGDYFRGKFKIMRPGTTRWVSPKTLGMKVR